jgi:CRP-like cAMP-binding protein
MTYLPTSGTRQRVRLVPCAVSYFSEYDSRELSMPLSNQTNDGVGNLILAALPRKDYRRLASHLEHIPLAFNEVLYNPGDTIQYVYFPEGALVCLLSNVEGHGSLEVGMVGKEGMVAISVFLGVKTSPNRALVQGKGSAFRMSAAVLRREANSTGSLQALLRRHTHALLTQVSQTAACNHFHQVEGRLARWLLMTQDRIRSDEFRLTQEFLSSMLGVRREGITNGARELQRNRLIAYSRGRIRILDRAGLEAAACSCYKVIKAESDSFLGL